MQKMVDAEDGRRWYWQVGSTFPAGPKKVPKNELENDPKIDSPKKGVKITLGGLQSRWHRDPDGMMD
jgi:hypothetical protein